MNKNIKVIIEAVVTISKKTVGAGRDGGCPVFIAMLCKSPHTNFFEFIFKINEVQCQYFKH